MNNFLEALKDRAVMGKKFNAKFKNDTEYIDDFLLKELKEKLLLAVREASSSWGVRWVVVYGFHDKEDIEDAFPQKLIDFFKKEGVPYDLLSRRELGNISIQSYQTIFPMEKNHYFLVIDLDKITPPDLEIIKLRESHSYLFKK